MFRRLPLTLVLAFALAGVVVGGNLSMSSAAAMERGSRTQGEGGYLTVLSEPTARIFIDDADTGHSTPQTRMRLAVGRHRLTLVSSDGKLRRSLGFAITKDAETKLRVNL